MGHTAETYYGIWEYNGLLLNSYMDEQKQELCCQNKAVLLHWATQTNA